MMNYYQHPQHQEEGENNPSQPHNIIHNPIEVSTAATTAQQNSTSPYSFMMNDDPLLSSASSTSFPSNDLQEYEHGRSITSTLQKSSSSSSLLSGEMDDIGNLIFYESSSMNDHHSKKESTIITTTTTTTASESFYSHHYPFPTTTDDGDDCDWDDLSEASDYVDSDDDDDADVDDQDDYHDNNSDTYDHDIGKCDGYDDRINSSYTILMSQLQLNGTPCTGTCTGTFLPKQSIVGTKSDSSTSITSSTTTASSSTSSSSSSSSSSTTATFKRNTLVRFHSNIVTETHVLPCMSEEERSKLYFSGHELQKNIDSDKQARRNRINVEKPSLLL